MAQPFQTPSNEKSFSGLIDAAILATGKPMSLINAVQYANMTVRECQSFGLFAQDLVEDVIYPDQDAYVWTRPSFFRRARTFKYLTADVYPKLLLPGKVQRNESWYYYAADDYFVFKGVDTGEQIASAVYYWLRPLPYYAQLGVSTSLFPGGPYATRPAYFDTLTDEWMYLNTAEDAYEATEPTDADARQALASNWLVKDWNDLILSGTKAKIWNQAGDPRSANEYSLYKQMQTLLRNTSGYESEGF